MTNAFRTLCYVFRTEGKLEVTVPAVFMPQLLEALGFGKPGWLPAFNKPKRLREALGTHG